MRIKVHTKRCMSSGACLIEAPQLFAHDENGLVVVRVSTPAASDHPAARAAAAACPGAVIELEETPEEQAP